METVAWVTTINGYYYGIDVTSDYLSNEELERELKTVLEHFYQIDPGRAANAYPLKTTAEFVSPRFSYHVITDENGWRTYSPKEQTGTYAEYVATDPHIDAWLGVFPIDLHGYKPSLEALSSALLELIGFSEKDNKFTAKKTVEHDGFPAIQLEFERTIDGVEILTRCEVVSVDGAAYLLTVAIPVSQKAQKEDIFARMSAVKLGHNSSSSSKAAELPREARLSEGIVFSRLGAIYFEKKQYEAALGYYRHAVVSSPEDVSPLLGALGVFNRLQRYQDGLAFLEEHLSHFSQSYDILAYQAYFQVQLGQKKEALRNYERAFSVGRREDEDFVQYIWLRWEMGNKEDVLREAKYYASTTDSIRIKRLVGNLYFQSGEYEQAAAVYSALRDRAPYDQATVTSLIEAYFRLERNSDVIVLCDEMAEHGYGSADLHYYKGRSEHALKWYKEAKRSFEMALAMNPADQASKDYLTHVSGMLGEGSNESIKQTIEPVPLPDFLTSAPPKVFQTGNEEADAVYLLRANGFNYQPGKERRRTLYTHARILTKKGVEAFSTLQYRFDPLKERIFVNQLIVKDEKGEVVASGDVSRYYVMDDTSGGMATYDKILHIPVPALMPGRTLEVTVSYRDLGRAEKLGFVDYPMFGVYPTVRAAIYVAGDSQRLKWRVPPKAKEYRDGNVRGWVLQAVPAFKQEYAQEDPQLFMPFVWIGDNNGTWQEVGRTYLEEIKAKLMLSPTVARLAADLTANVKTKDEKVRIFAHYVQSQLTYKAIEFGKRGVMPNLAEETLSNRYGDCKDHAVLLYQLLSAVGIEARLALVNTSQQVWGEFPSLDQFNHMIVYCPECGQQSYLDVTAKNLDPVGRTPQGLAHTGALILDSDRSRLEVIPEYQPEDTSVSTERTVEVYADGRMAVHELMQLDGYMASGFRSALKDVSAQERTDFVQRLMRSVDSGATVLRLETTNLHDISKPLVLAMDYTLGTQFLKAQGDLVGKLPSLWERYWFWYEPTQTRSTPFSIRYPVQMVTNVRLRLPGGYEIGEGVAQSASAQEPRFLKWEARKSRSEQGLAINYSAQLHPGHYRPEDYLLYGQALEQAFAFLESPITLRKAEYSQPGRVHSIHHSR